MSVDPPYDILMRIESKLDQLLAARAAAPRTASTATIADDADLDGQWGDPEVRKDPKRWDGESMVGRRFSETSPKFLQCLAGFLTWQADRDEQKTEDEQAQKYARYKRRDASRALGWAKRLESGWGAPAPAPAAAPASQPQADEDWGF